MSVAEHLQAAESDRGFAALPKIAGDYGGAVSVRESSSAEAPKLWLTVVELDDLCGPPDGPTHVATIHLTAEDAWKLADQLRHAVRNHYHCDATPEWADGSAS